MRRKISAFILAGAVFLTSVMSDGIAVNAAQESGEIVLPTQAQESGEIVLPAQAQESVFSAFEKAASNIEAAVTNNSGQQNYSVWSKTVKSYLMANDDGTMTRVEYTGSDVAVEKYSADGYILSSRRIQMELPLFGGFYAGSDYNFLVMGQTNMGEDDTREVIRVIKYDKNWNFEGKASLYGANTTKPFNSGSLRMAQSGDMLYVRTSHEMYKDENDLRHQANLTFSVKISTMEIKEEDSHVFNYTTGFVSHSFNQFIQVNGDKLLTVDHGDANPRCVVMFQYKSPAGKETGTGRLGMISHYVEILPIKGEKGNNYTGVSVGGFEYSDTHYLVAGNSIPLNGENLSTGKRDIFVSAVPTDYSEEVRVDTYETSGGSASTPQLVKINDQRFLLMWTVDDVLCSVFLNADGSQAGALTTVRGGALSDCQPIVVGDKVVWYATTKDVPLFFYIDLNSAAPRPRILNQTHNVTYDLMGGTMADMSTKTVEYGSPYGTLPTPTQSGRIFLGWYTDPTEGSLVTEDSIVKAAGDETLYARWLVKESCGNGLTWDIKDKTLIIEGKGSMVNWNTSKAQPWYGCRDQFDKVVIKEGVTSVGTYAFYNYSNIKEITLPQSLSGIGGFAFSNCNLLKNFEIPSQVASIGEFALKGCSGLKCVEVPAGVTYINYGVFNGCSSLTEVILPDSITRIESYAFDGCSALNALKLPDKLQSMGGYAFAGCSSLKRIEIPDGMSAIYESTFKNCSSLEWISIPLTVTSMQGEIFAGCGSSLKIAGYKGSEAEKYAKKYNIGFEQRSYTFKGSCGKALTWELTDGIMTIQGKGEMTDFSWYKDVPWFDYRDLIEDLVICNGVTSIAPFAFYNCRNLSSVTCSESVMEIGNQTFQYCESLRNVKFSKNIRSIGSRVFYNCSSLSSIILPDGLTEIKWALFGKCSGLEEITIPGTVTAIDSLAFEGHGESLIIYGAKGSKAQDFATENEIEFREISYQYSGNYGAHSWKLENGVLTISGNGAMKDVGGFSDVPWYPYRSLVESVVVEDGITKIGAGAFYGCCNAGSVSLPTSLTSVGDNAFRNCSSLTEIIVPDSVSALGTSAFHGCSSLKSFRFPESVTNVSNYQFYGCTSLTEVHLPENLKTIGMYAFWGCNSLGSVAFTESLTEIDTNAFYGCTALRELEIPKTISRLPYKVFSGCSGLEKVTVPLEVRTIDDTAFENCSRLVIYGYKGSHAEEYAASHTIKFSPVYVNGSGECGENLTWELKEGVLKIDGTGRMNTVSTYSEIPWASCQTQIEKVVIADGVTYIGAYAFYNCSSLTDITIPESVTEIGKYAFYGCGKLTEIVLSGNLETIGTSAFERCTGLVSINLPQRLTVMENKLFSGCTSLTAITVPKNVTKIGNSVFYGCEKLTDITIPENVTAIGAEAFYGCGSIERLTLPENVTSIGAGAFLNCSSLTEFTIPGSVSRLESGTFSGCGELLAVTIPGGVTEINDTAFAGCGKLEIYGYKDSAAQIYAANHAIVFHDLSAGADEGNVQLLKWKLEDGVLTISGEGAMPEWGAFTKPPWNSKYKLVKEVVIEEGITTVGSYAFYGYSGIRKVTLAESVKKIGDYAFCGCRGLTDIKIPFMTTSIGNYAFQQCTSLKTVQLFEGMTRIGDYAFQQCDSLESISIPKGVKEIGKQSFDRCTKLSSVEFPEGLEIIGEYAFYQCSSLQGLELPDSVTKIGQFAFYGCIRVKELVVPRGVTALEEFTFAGYVLNSVTIPETVETIASTAVAARVFYGFKGSAAEKFVKDSMDFVDISDGYSGVCGDNTIWHLKDGTLTISGKGKMSEWVNGTVPWYLLTENIREVVIEEGVTSIMRDAFKGCGNIESVMVPLSVDKIYDSAFLECSKETAIQGYPDTIAEQFARENGMPFIARYYSGEGAWGENLHWKLDERVLTISGTGDMPDDAVPWKGYQKLIKEVVIEEGVTSVRSYMFSGYSNMRKAEIADSVTKIGESAFFNCSSLTDVTLPDTITDIPSAMFYNCSSLTKITIPDSVTKIQSHAFEECTGLKNIALPAGVTYIGSCAFQNCGSLENITIPEKVEEIPSCTFRYCKALKSIEIPESVKKIREGAFSGCSGLEGARFPITVALIEKDVFKGCDEKLTIYCAKNSAIDEYAINNNINVSEYSYEVSGSGDNAAWNLKDGVMSVSGNGKIMSSDARSWAGYKEQIVHVEIKEGITSIQGFSGYSRLRSVDIPEGVTDIEMRAFENCVSLGSIAFPSTLSRIESYGFSGCTALKEVWFYGNKRSFGQFEFFQNVTANGYYPLNNPTWEGVSESFYGGTFTWSGFYPAEGTCGDLTWTIDGAGTLAIDGNGKMASYGSEEAVPWYAYRDKIKRVVIGAGVESIGAYAFSGCTFITDITFQGSKPVFGENAFYGVTAEVCHPAGDSSWEHIEEEITGGTLSWSDHFHIEVKDNAKAATCTEPGISSGSHCSVCGKVFIQQMEIQALGHLEKEIQGTAQKETCTAPGWTALIVCSRCKITLKEPEEIPATGHQWEEDESSFSAPTCTERGYRRYICTRCRDSKIDDTLPTGHKYTGDYKVCQKANCKQTGLKAAVCAECGYYDLDHMEEIPLGDHEFEYRVLTKPTCTSEGRAAYVCRYCRSEKEGASEKIAQEPHELVFRAEYAGTCKNSGEIAHWKCSNCNRMFADENAQEQLTSVKTNKLGPHYYIDGICFFCDEKEPTGTDPGTDPGTTPGTDPGTDPGTTPGTDPGTTPGTDPGTTPGTEPGPNPGTSACEHNWGAWQKISEATVFAPEKQKCICVKCGDSKEREYGNVLKPYIKLTANSLKMQVKQSTNKFKVTGMARGDWLASVKSENTKVLKVSKVNRTGTFTLKAQKKTGTVKLTITLASGLKKTIKVSVGKAKVKTTKITVELKKISLKRGKKTTLKPVIAPVTSQEKVTYKSSNKKIAAVNAKGVITAKKNGTAKITVVSGKKKVIVTVKVTK